VTLLGIVILVNLLQLRKALAPMLVTPLPMVTLLKLVHPLKVSFPMLLVTLLGIVMLVKLVHD
jgi:hypothetical protein